MEVVLRVDLRGGKLVLRVDLLTYGAKAPEIEEGGRGEGGF